MKVLSKTPPQVHHCRTLEPYLTLIQKGLKKIEGRTFSPKYQQFRPGDILHLYNEQNETWCKLNCLRTYKTFRDMLLAEGLDQVVPNVKTVDEGVCIYESFPNYFEEAEYGVVALEVELVKPPHLLGG
jgi:ASC-1-like (ASCH) protein